MHSMVEAQRKDDDGPFSDVCIQFVVPGNGSEAVDHLKQLLVSRQPVVEESGRRFVGADLLPETVKAGWGPVTPSHNRLRFTVIGERVE